MRHMANAFDGDTRGLDPQTRSLVARRDAVLAPSYRLFYDRPLHLVAGSGVWLTAADGRRYLDAYNNVPVIGHAHPEITRAVSAQLTRLNTHTRYLTDEVVAYSERLLALFPQDLSQVVYTCTGSEAVDLAVRTARYATGASGVICTAHAYHGTTATAAQLSPSLGPNNALGPDVVTVPAPIPSKPDAGQRFADDVRAAIEQLRARGVGLAAMIIDSVLSSDGVLGIGEAPSGAPGSDLLVPAYQAVHEAGGLWIGDEVQPGFGRTGTWWGFDNRRLVPDLVVLGKPMGNGLPIAAVVGRAEVLAGFGRDIRYFNTFGGNQVCIAAAAVVLTVIERDGLRHNATEVGRDLVGGLRELAAGHGCLGEVRGAGLFVGVDVLDDDGAPDPVSAAGIVNGLRERGVLISASGPAANVLKIRPPLPFSSEEGRLLLDRLADTLTGARQ